MTVIRRIWDGTQWQQVGTYFIDRVSYTLPTDLRPSLTETLPLGSGMTDNVSGVRTP